MEPSFLYSNRYISIKQVEIRRLAIGLFIPLPCLSAINPQCSIDHQTPGVYSYTYGLESQNPLQYPHLQNLMASGDVFVIQ